MALPSENDFIGRQLGHMLGRKTVNRQAVIAAIYFGDSEADAVTRLTSSALLKEPSRVAHELNAIGLSAKVAIIFGVNPMFLEPSSFWPPTGSVSPRMFLRRHHDETEDYARSARNLGDLG